jgi:hypothetical protein
MPLILFLGGIYGGVALIEWLIKPTKLPDASNDSFIDRL